MSLFLINDIKNHVEANQWNEALSYIGDSAFRDSKNERFVKALNSLKEGYNIYEGNPQGLVSEEEFETWLNKLEKIYNLFNDDKNKPEEGLNLQLGEFKRLIKDLKDVKELCHAKKCLVYQLIINEDTNSNKETKETYTLKKNYFEELDTFFNDANSDLPYQGYPSIGDRRRQSTITNGQNALNKALRTFTIKSTSRNTFYDLGKKYSYEGVVNLATDAINYQAERPKKIRTRPTYHLDANSKDKSKIVKNTIINLKKLSQQEINENEDIQILLNIILRILNKQDLKSVNEESIDYEKKNRIFSIIPIEVDVDDIKNYVKQAYKNRKNEKTFKNNGADISKETLEQAIDYSDEKLLKSIFDELPSTEEKAKIQSKTMPITVGMIFSKYYYYKLEYDKKFKEDIFGIIILPELKENSINSGSEIILNETLETYDNFIANEIGVVGRELSINDYEKFFMVYLRKIAMKDLKNNTNIYMSILRILYDYLQLGHNSYFQLTPETIENIPLMVYAEELNKFKIAYGETQTLFNYLEQINDLSEHEKINLKKKSKKSFEVNENGDNTELEPFPYMLRAHNLLVNKYQSFVKGSVKTEITRKSSSNNSDWEHLVNRNHQVETVPDLQETEDGDTFSQIDNNRNLNNEDTQDELEQREIGKNLWPSLEIFINAAMNPMSPLKLDKKEVYNIKSPNGRILPLNYWQLVHILEKEYDELFSDIAPNEKDKKNPSKKTQLINTKINEEFINSSGLYSNMKEKEIKNHIKTKLLEKYDGDEFKLYEDLLKERANKTGSDETDTLEKLKLYIAIKEKVDFLRKIENDEKEDSAKIILTPFDKEKKIPRVAMTLIYLHGVKSSRGDRSSIEYILKEQKENSNKMTALFTESNFHEWINKDILQESFLDYDEDQKIGIVFAYNYYCNNYAKSDIIDEFNRRYNKELSMEDIKRCMVAFFAKINK